MTVLNKQQSFKYEGKSLEDRDERIGDVTQSKYRKISFSGNVDGKEIGVYLIDGEYYALEDVCPHA